MWAIYFRHDEWWRVTNLLPKTTIKLNKTIKNNPFSTLESDQRYNRVTNHPDFLGTVPVLALRVLHPGKLHPKMWKIHFQPWLLMFGGERCQTQTVAPKIGVESNTLLVSNRYSMDYPSTATITVFHPDHWCWWPWFPVPNSGSSVIIHLGMQLKFAT